MTTQLIQLTSQGQGAPIDAPDTLFRDDVHKHSLYLALNRELAHRRSGSANSKTRAEVRGGGRKPWKQKGTGRARVGSIRSPLWVGGGVTFGPKPRKFTIKLNKKVRRIALHSALTARQSVMYYVEDFSFLAQPSTKALFTYFAANQLVGTKLLIIANYKAEANQHLMLSARNLEGVTVTLPSNLSVHDLLKAKAVVITADALAQLKEGLLSHV
jgi:large subunit ribosomal protein L4